MQLKSKLTILLFLLTIFGFSAAHFLLPDGDISASERRKLAQAPELSATTVLNGKYGTDLEKYLLDQFPLRDGLRSLKAHWQFDIYRLQDNNGLYVVDGSICKLDKDLKEPQVSAAISNTNGIYEKYLQGMNVWFALLPDKNYFAAQPNGYPSLDYGRMDALLSEGLNKNISYLGMAPFGQLTLEDYYNTDLHWRQERLESVVAGLSSSMGFAMPDFQSYIQTEYAPFHGAYYGQSALYPPADTLVTLSNPTIDGSVVTGVEFSGEKAVYDPSDLDNTDLYDLYLSGPQAIVTVTTPNGTTGKELILFRDSFGSSLAPLLLDSYDTITLVDMRYVTTALLEQYLSFEDQDVLFLYNTSLVNSGLLLK